MGLTAIVFAMAFLWVLVPLRVEILTPRLGIPTITQAGKEIGIKLKSSLPFYFPAIQWSLRQGGDQYELPQISAHTTFARRQVVVKLPANIKAGAYSLVARLDNGEEIEHRKTVHVIDAIGEDFSIVQLADLPTLGGDGKGDELLRQIIGEINIINPNVVLFTGDVAYGGSWDQYRRLVEAMALLDAPVIVVAGNHEYEGWAGYLHYFLEPYHAVDYGRYKFISLNSGHNRDQMSESQFQWLLTQLHAAHDQTSIVQIHHPIQHKQGQGGYVHVKARELTELFTKHRVPIVLSGHWHGDMVFDEHGNDRRDTWNFPGTAYVVTTTAGADLRREYSASPLHHGYRLIRLKNSKLVSYTYDYDGNGQRDAAASIPVGKLNITRQANNIVTVKNKLNELLPNARLKISTEDLNVLLRPTRGKLIRCTADTRGDKRGGVCEVLVDLPANSVTTVELKQ